MKRIPRLKDISYHVIHNHDTQEVLDDSEHKWIQDIQDIVYEDSLLLKSGFPPLSYPRVIFPHQ